MKKNRLMRAAVLLLALTLMTSCFVGGTFAKYATEGTTGLQTARVAKWGVTVTGGGSLFAESYDETNGVTVQSVDKVVAPGTDGSLADFQIVGEPEVSVTVTYTATVELTGRWEDEDGKFYCPLQVTVGSTTLCGLDYADAAAFATAIKGEIDGSTDFAVGTPLTGAGVNVSWEWLFDEDEHADLNHASHVDGITQNDDRDTYLGDLAADDTLPEADMPTISVTVSCVVEQVD